MKKLILPVVFSSIMLIGFTMQNSAQSAEIVQAAQLCNRENPETTPSSRFDVNRTDGTIFDKKTKLTWKICAEGQIFSGGHCTGKASDFYWDSAMQHFGSKGKNWRLPKESELISLVEERCENPTINLEVFPDTTASYFWTSSSSNTTDATYVSFYTGRAHPFNKNSSYYVRLVRGVEWLDPSEMQERRQSEMAAKAVARANAEWKARGGVRIGMTVAQALASNWGKPSEIHRTTTARGTSEQWVYGSTNYLYFENGILTAIQN